MRRIELLRNADLESGRRSCACALPEGVPGTLRTGRATTRWVELAIAVDLALDPAEAAATPRELRRCSMARAGHRQDPATGRGGYWIADVQIHALRGDKAKALAALREAEKAGWRGPIGATTATSTRTSPRSATNPNSRPCSPTSSATWRASVPNSLTGRRMRRSTLRQLLESLDPSTNSVRALGSQVVSIQGVTGCRRGRRLVLRKYWIRDKLTPSRDLRGAAA